MPFTCQAERETLENNVARANRVGVGKAEADKAWDEAWHRPEGPEYPIPNEGSATNQEELKILDNARNIPTTPGTLKPGVVPGNPPLTDQAARDREAQRVAAEQKAVDREAAVGVKAPAPMQPFGATGIAGPGNGTV